MKPILQTDWPPTSRQKPEPPDTNSARDWPDPYKPNPDLTHSPPAPGWSKPAVLELGRFVASQLLADSNFGNSYLRIVKGARVNNEWEERIDDYRTLLNALVVLKMRPPIPPMFSAAAFAAFNSNDFANVHHRAWLAVVGALAHLTNLNPHGNWGEPPANSSSHPAKRSLSRR